MAKGNERISDLTLGIDIKQSVHFGIHESADYLGRYSKSRGDGQEIG
jgi:hypothetical protein